MAIVQEIPTLDALLESVLDRLPPEAVASIAAMQPPTAGSTFADEIVRRAHDRARARRGDEIRPLPDEPKFNEETQRILKDVREGVNVKRYETAEDFFSAHGF